MRKKYDTLLLDADGTLFDFPRAERQAFELTCAELRLPGDAAAYELYSTINDGYWKKLERGEVSKDALVLLRFEDFLQALGREGDSAKINALYVKNLGKGSFLLPHAESVCRELKRHCRLILATNGIADVQRNRLLGSAIADVVTEMIPSETAGAAKPDAQYFTYLFEQCSLRDKSRVLMVGDSLGADVKGGIDFGIDTCWLNPRGVGAPPDWEITYTISGISELPDIVFSQDAASAALTH